MPAGTVLFETGQPGDVLYVVLSGKVEIRIGGQVVETVGEGGIVGEMTLIDKAPRSADAVVVSEAAVVALHGRHG